MSVRNRLFFRNFTEFAGGIFSNTYETRVYRKMIAIVRFCQDVKIRDIAVPHRTNVRRRTASLLVVVHDFVL